MSIISRLAGRADLDQLGKQADSPAAEVAELTAEVERAEAATIADAADPEGYAQADAAAKDAAARLAERVRRLERVRAAYYGQVLDETREHLAKLAAQVSELAERKDRTYKEIAAEKRRAEQAFEAACRDLDARLAAAKVELDARTNEAAILQRAADALTARVPPGEKVRLARAVREIIPAIGAYRAAALAAVPAERAAERARAAANHKRTAPTPDDAAIRDAERAADRLLAEFESAVALRSEAAKRLAAAEGALTAAIVEAKQAADRLRT